MNLHKLLVLTIAALAAQVAAKASLAQEVEAYVGRPFGVGRILIGASGQDAAMIRDINGLSIQSDDNRIFYPAFAPGGEGVGQQILEGLLGRRLNLGAKNVDVYFLFKGDQPLDVNIYTPNLRQIRVVPRQAPPDFHDRLLTRWWRQYQESIRQRRDQGDYPPVVETYLTGMLAARTQMKPPESFLSQSSDSAGRQTLELVLGIEKLRQSVMAETLLGRDARELVADLPPPREINWPPLPLPNLEQEPQIEPMAMRVPEECFYVRFGSVNNFVWMRHLMDDYSGDITRMVTRRGRNDEMSERVERQIAMRYSKLLEMFGEQVASDMALVGQDAFVKEGAAIGMMFHARGDTLGIALDQERLSAMRRAKDRGATETKVEIAGQQVSLVSTPDHYLRSFHAVDGRFHLVTNCENMVRRFFETGEGKGALGATAEFRHARSAMPVSRDYTLFIYASSKFLQGLVSPQYQIELRRRLRAATDIEIYRLARLAAKSEGLPFGSIQELIQSGLLPPTFAQRLDGSQVVVDGDQVYDSKRGGRGHFLPVPDVKIEGVTAEEAARHEAIVQYHQEKWGQMDPLMLGVGREALDDEGLERISFEARLHPFSSSQYGGAPSLLAPAQRQTVTAAQGDIINFEAHLQGGLFANGVPPHLLFLGIQDAPPLTNWRGGGLLETLSLVRSTPGYLGGVPRPGFLDRLPGVLAPRPPDQFGYSRLLLGLWRRVWADYSVLSFDRRLLDRLPAELQVQQAAEPAQIRYRIGDLSTSHLADWISHMSFNRVKGASEGNAMLFHLISQQFHVPRAQAKEKAEQILDTKLTCTLGGDYQLTAHRSGLEYWRSDAWDKPPSEHRAAFLEWFRGAEGKLLHENDRLLYSGHLRMQRNREAKPSLAPFLDLFRGNN